MDIRILRYFLAVSRAENITKAAQILHIAQPSLSKQLIELEQELGKSLLVREKRRVTLTEDGVFLAKRAEEILALFDKTQREITTDPESIRGDIAIGTGETHALDAVAQVIAQLAARYPDIHYHLFSGDSTAVSGMLDRGTLDFAIITEPVDILKYESLRLPAMDCWGVLMPDGHPLAGKGTVCLPDLMEVPLIVPERVGLRRQFTLGLGEDFQKLNVVATYNLAYSASLLVQRHIGCAIVTDMLIPSGEGTGLHFRPFDPPMELHLSIIWKRHQAFSKAGNKFLELLHRNFDAISKKTM